MLIKSPITNSENIFLEKEINSSFVIQQYKTDLGIDVSRFFKDINKINIYKCLDTGYRFYFPFNLVGDDIFYQELEKFPWYYADVKWEYEVAADFVNKKDKVLEIGCGLGSFIKKIKEKASIVEGLEMNSKALQNCLNDGLSVYPDTIDIFSNKKTEYFDIVCSFQVLEHVADINDFLKTSLKALKPGGKMIISVPNNDCLIFKSNNVALNTPPHHMGMWDMNSLINLQKYFNIEIESIHLEPLQKQHIGYAQIIINKAFMVKMKEKIGIFSLLLNKLYEGLAYVAADTMSDNTIGHSILIVFKKKHDKQ